MNNTDIIHIFLYSIPEALAVISLSTVLAGSGFIWKRLVIMGLFIGLFSHFWRLLLSDYILNIIIYTIILIVFMTFYRLGNDLFARAISTLLAISIYLTIEFVNLKIFDLVFGLNPIDMLAKPLLRYICFAGQISIIFLICALLMYLKFSLFGRVFDEEI